MNPSADRFADYAGLTPPETQEQFEQNVQDMLQLLRDANDGSIMTLCVPELVQADFAARSLTLCYTPAPWMRNFSGALHGGMLATFADSSFGLLGRCLAGQTGIVTSNLNINYLRGVRMDAPLYLRARAEHLGRSTVCLYGTGWQNGAQADPCVSATGTFFLLR